MALLTSLRSAKSCGAVKPGLHGEAELIITVFLERLLGDALGIGIGRRLGVLRRGFGLLALHIVVEEHVPGLVGVLALVNLLGRLPQNLDGLLSAAGFVQTYLHQGLLLV